MVVYLRMIAISVFFVLASSTQIVMGENSADPDKKDTKIKDKAKEIATKTMIKEGVKVLSKKATPIVDVLWPSEIGEDPAIEDPSSIEYKMRQETLAKEQMEKEKAMQERAAIKKAAKEKASQEKAAIDKAAKEKAAQKKAAIDKAAKDKAAKEQAEHEKTMEKHERELERFKREGGNFRAPF